MKLYVNIEDNVNVDRFVRSVEERGYKCFVARDSNNKNLINKVCKHMKCKDVKELNKKLDKKEFTTYMCYDTTTNEMVVIIAE